jgi:hypothetical protein
MLGFGAALPIWAPKVDAFLAGNRSAHNPTHREYMPSDVALPSHCATFGDVTALPNLGDEGEAYYEHFLAKTLPRAIAIGLSSAASFASGFDPRVQALKACQQRTRNCQLYAVDNCRPGQTHPSAVTDPIRGSGEFERLAAPGREGPRRLTYGFDNAQAPRLCYRN